MKAIVAPQGFDKYPKYLANFGEVIAFTCMEEAHAPERDFVFATVEEGNLCAYEYLDSTWLKSYEAWIPFFTGDDTSSFYHYLIFGGDNNIEVITPNQPTIDIIKERTVLKIEYTL